MRTALVLVLLFGCQTKKAVLPVGIVEQRDLIRKVTFPGNLVPEKKTVINAPFAGYIRNIYFKVGEKVRKGQPLVLVTPTIKAEHGFPILAAFDGTVVAVLKTVGEYVDTTPALASILRLEDRSRMYVDGLAPEGAIYGLKIGQSAFVRTVAIPGEDLTGKVDMIALAAKETPGQERVKVEYPVRVKLDETGPEYRSGMSVFVDIVVEKRTKALALAQQFVEQEGGAAFVTLEDGSRKKVKLGLQTEDHFEILEGLNAQDKVQQVDFLSLEKGRRP